MYSNIAGFSMAENWLVLSPRLLIFLLLQFSTRVGEWNLLFQSLKATKLRLFSCCLHLRASRKITSKMCRKIREVLSDKKNTAALTFLEERAKERLKSIARASNFPDRGKYCLFFRLIKMSFCVPKKSQPLFSKRQQLPRFSGNNKNIFVECCTVPLSSVSIRK